MISYCLASISYSCLLLTTFLFFFLVIVATLLMKCYMNTGELHQEGRDKVNGLLKTSEWLCTVAKLKSV